MTNEKKYYYAWVGQNASTGTPHPITGRMSMYGDNMVFDSKNDRDRFVSDFYSDNPSKYAVACTKRELRRYNLGSTVSDFEQDLYYCRYGYVEDEDGDKYCEKLF